MFQLPALVSHWWIKTRWLIDASIWLRGKLVDGIWNESEKIKEWLLHQTFHSPTVTFFLVLTMGACLYSDLLLRHSSPLSWWFFMFMASCMTRDIGSLCWDNTVTLNLAGSPLCLVVWWVYMKDLSDFLEYAFWCSFPCVKILRDDSPW